MKQHHCGKSDRTRPFSLSIFIPGAVALCLLLGSGIGYTEDDRDSRGIQAEWRNLGWSELLAVADSLNEALQVDLAMAVARLALDKVEAERGLSDTAVARVLDALGECYANETDYASADSALSRALSIRMDAFGPAHKDVAGTMNRLARIYVVEEHYADAESLLVRALEIRETIQGPTHADVGEVLSTLAKALFHQGKYDEGEEAARRALSICEEAYGPIHLHVATALNTLATMLVMRCKYAEAEPLYKRALTINEEILGPVHQEVAMLLANLALLCERQRKYSEAELLYERAIPVLEKTVGPRHRHTQQAVNNLAVLYLSQARYAEAKPLFEQVLTIRENILGPGHSEVAGALHNLAIIAKQLGEYDEAEKIYERAIGIREKILGPDHPSLAESLLGLFNVYMRNKRYTEAESLMDRIIGIYGAIYGPDHPSSATTMHGQARLRMVKGEYEKADSLIRHAIGIWEAIYGDSHSQVAGGLETYSDLLRLKERGIDALEAAERAFMIRRRDFLDNSLLLSEPKALNFAQSLRNSADNYLSCFLDAETRDPVSVAAAASIVLSAKGQVTQVMLDRQQTLALEADSTTRALTEALRDVRNELSNRIMSQQTKASDPDADELASTMDSLKEMADYLDEKLSRQSPLLKRQRERSEITANRVSTALPDDAVLLEYKRYRYLPAEYNSKPISGYLLAAIDPGGSAYLFDLGEADQIDSLITEYREHMLRVSLQSHMPLIADKEEYEAMARKLYDAVVRPVEHCLVDKKLVLVSPDGGLNLISFAGLVDDAGSYLIEKCALHYLSAGRDILRVDDESDCGHGLLAIGDPDYDAPPVSGSDDAGGDRYAATDRFSSTLSIARAGREYFDGHNLGDLPGTRAEIRAISNSWRSSNDEAVVTYFGGEATEDMFKTEAPGKRIIHLATHGYCISDESEQSLQVDRDETRSSFVGANPLLQSGLFFAGANYRGVDAERVGAEDGILTAYEVATMDLRCTEMVVLSACETGIGEVRQGEGVYGLRRAFRMAGVRTIISALWSVPDMETAAIMSEIYTKSGETVPEKLRRVQLDRIARLRSENRTDHPYRWAAFVAVGDWR